MKSILLKVLIFVPIQLAQFSFFSEKMALNADKTRVFVV